MKKISAENTIFFISYFSLDKWTSSRVVKLAPENIKHRKSIKAGTCFLLKLINTDADILQEVRDAWVLPPVLG